MDDAGDAVALWAEKRRYTPGNTRFKLKFGWSRRAQIPQGFLDNKDPPKKVERCASIRRVGSWSQPTRTFNKLLAVKWLPDAVKKWLSEAFTKDNDEDLHAKWKRNTLYSEKLVSTLNPGVHG